MNIFLAFTPYHSLLAYAIALSQEKNENILFIIAEFPEAEVLSRVLRDSMFRVFTNVVCLPGAHKGRSVFAKVFIRKRNALYLKKFIIGHRIENVFVGNNSRIEAQAALHYAKSAYQDCKGIYIEDGTAAYRSEFPAFKNFFTKLFCKILFGSWWKDENILGVSPRIDICQVLFPEFIRKELKSKQIVAVNKEKFLHIRNDKTFVEYFKFFNLSARAIQNMDVFLICPHSDVEKDCPRLKEAMRTILFYIKENKLRLAVKYHPRELSDDYLLQKNKKNVLVLPRAIPLELLYIFISKPPKLIIGGHSTALLTARWIFTGAKIISVAPLFEYYDYNIFKTFRKNNISFISNVRDIKNMLGARVK